VPPCCRDKASEHGERDLLRVAVPPAHRNSGEEPVTTSRLLIAVFLILGPNVSDAATLFEQLPGADSSSQLISSTLNNLGGTPGFRVADNFQLAGGGTVSTVEWWGTLRSGGTSFQITFYPDSSGNPGLPLSTIAVVPASSSATAGSPFDPVTFYSATLSTPFSAAPGTPYWLSVFDAAPDALGLAECKCRHVWRAPNAKRHHDVEHYR